MSGSDSTSTRSSDTGSVSSSDSERDDHEERQRRAEEREDARADVIPRMLRPWTEPTETLRTAIDSVDSATASDLASMHEKVLYAGAAMVNGGAIVMGLKVRETVREMLPSPSVATAPSVVVETLERNGVLKGHFKDIVGEGLGWEATVALDGELVKLSSLTDEVLFDMSGHPECGIATASFFKGGREYLLHRATTRWSWHITRVDCITMMIYGGRVQATSHAYAVLSNGMTVRLGRPVSATGKIVSDQHARVSRSWGGF